MSALAYLVSLARKRGQDDVLEVCRKHLPASEAAFIESLVTSVERTPETPEAPLPVSARARTFSAVLSTGAALRSTAPQGEESVSRESQATA